MPDQLPKRSKTPAQEAFETLAFLWGGAAIGAFIFGMVQQGIVYAGWEPDWFKFFMGVMLLFAVIANNAFRNYAAKR